MLRTVHFSRSGRACPVGCHTPTSSAAAANNTASAAQRQPPGVGYHPRGPRLSTLSQSAAKPVQQLDGRLRLARTAGKLRSRACSAINSQTAHSTQMARGIIAAGRRCQVRAGTSLVSCSACYCGGVEAARPRRGRRARRRTAGLCSFARHEPMPLGPGAAHAWAPPGLSTVASTSLTSG